MRIVAKYSLKGGEQAVQSKYPHLLSEIDSTGAGDTSMAGFTYEYLRTKDIVKSACFAGATSSIMIENVGPDFEMTEQMVRVRAGKLLEKIESGWELGVGANL